MHQSPEKSCRAEALHVKPGFSAVGLIRAFNGRWYEQSQYMQHVLLSKQGSNITSLREAGERWEAFWRW